MRASSRRLRQFVPKKLRQNHEPKGTRNCTQDVKDHGTPSNIPTLVPTPHSPFLYAPFLGYRRLAVWRARPVHPPHRSRLMSASLYQLVNTYSGSNFFNEFIYNTFPDPTNGARPLIFPRLQLIHLL
jgi:hypothetical protein